MQMLAYSTLAVALADAMVRARFSLRFGIHSHAEYLEFILRRSTVHLAPGLQAYVTRTAGSQRSMARPFLRE